MIDIKVGDRIRWDSQHATDLWAEGEVLTLHDENRHCVMRLTSKSDRMTYRIGEPFSFRRYEPGIRRIEHPDPGQHAFVRGPDSGAERRGPPDETCAVCQSDPRNEIHMKHPVSLTKGTGARQPSQPSSALIDGLTPTQCYTQWSNNRAILERGGQPMYKLTPAQIAAGRAAYQADALNEWSDELRGLQILARERERLQVVVDMDVD